jgi:hypothetical protein
LELGKSLARLRGGSEVFTKLQPAGWRIHTLVWGGSFGIVGSGSTDELGVKWTLLGDGGVEVVGWRPE